MSFEQMPSPASKDEKKPDPAKRQPAGWRKKIMTGLLSTAASFGMGEASRDKGIDILPHSGARIVPRKEQEGRIEFETHDPMEDLQRNPEPEQKKEEPALKEESQQE